MKRRILLLEPKYKNKYPPIGLMKIATYHRALGDEVQFFKGDMKDLALDELASSCIQKLEGIQNDQDWKLKFYLIREYIKTRKATIFDDLRISEHWASFSLLKNCLDRSSDIYRKKQYENFPKWNRVYVTTLFTFYWKVTVEAIHYAKNFVTSLDDIKVGGVLASLLHEELRLETGITPHQGLLDKRGSLDPDNNIARGIVIDDLPLDYSILDEIDYRYPTGSAYFTFMTKGCTRKCAFCSVPILEPTYKPKIDTIGKFGDIKELFGEQQHLLLMDNNVLASPKFPEIIQEIKDMGFTKGATYIEPNQLDIAVKNLADGINEKAYVRRTFRLLDELLAKLKHPTKQNFYDILFEHGLSRLEAATKEGILTAYPLLKDLYEKYRSKIPRMRYVDFNQGTDARYVTDELMRLMSEIPIRPLRIAFDYWGMRDKYEKAVRLAAKYGIKELSNYILYNFKDTPDELYNRLKINVELGEELGMQIYSFPMKYIPLFGEDAKHRDFIGSKWNRKYIRAIQSILNVTKGIVAPKRDFFYKAFGEDLEQFHELLLMPEVYIVYRYYFEGIGATKAWREQLHDLAPKQRQIALSIIEKGDFKEYEQLTKSKTLLAFLEHYRVRKDDLSEFQKRDLEYRRTKLEYDRIVKEDPFVDLTLTYDYEDRGSTIVSAAGA